MSKRKKGLTVLAVLFWIVAIQLLILHATTEWSVSDFWIAQYWVSVFLGYIATGYVWIEVK